MSLCLNNVSELYLNWNIGQAIAWLAWEVTPALHTDLLCGEQGRQHLSSFGLLDEDRKQYETVLTKFKGYFVKTTWSLNTREI